MCKRKWRICYFTPIKIVLLFSELVLNNKSLYCIFIQNSAGGIAKVYIISETNPTFEDYQALHQTTGWNAKGLYTYEQLFQAICRSWYSISIYDEQTLIGYGRIISDGIYQTFICDVMVHSEYQRNGIGTTIMEALLAHCKLKNIKWIQLSCAKGKQPFYQKLGFSERDADAPGMMLFFE